MGEAAVREARSAAPFLDPIEMASLDTRTRYKMLTGTVIPRPIAWVTTMSRDGVVNAAPFSQFIIAAYEPALLAISIGRGPADRKDTLRNIEETGEFVINMVPEGSAEAVQRSAEELPPHVSEPALIGLDLIASTTVAVPRLAVSPVQFECRLHRIIPLGGEPNRLVVGEAVVMHSAATVIVDGRIDLDRYRPLGRIGGRNYVTMGGIVSV